jgi:hypothetical protein
VKLMAVLVALLTPEMLERTMQLFKALLTDERLTRCAAVLSMYWTSVLTAQALARLTLPCLPVTCTMVHMA